MLTDRGRWALALGGATYLAGWAFGSKALYPIALGLVLAVAVAALWVRLIAKPVRLRRVVPGGEHVDGDDIPVTLQLELEGRVAPSSLVLVERISRLGQHETILSGRRKWLEGGYVLSSVPRGRYPIESAGVVIEDPFGLERVELELEAAGALLVYPRLVDLDGLFSESGSRMHEGRRLLLRRQSGFDLHSVRDYEQGESLRRVHWPSTAKRGHLMVKELEDAPRDEVLVLLDADASVVTGTPPESSFEVALRAAGSIVRSHARRGRRAGLFINGMRPRYQAVHSLEGDWSLALELLAAAEPDGIYPAAALLAEGAGVAVRALELTVVTSALSGRLVDRLLQRAATRRGTAVVYVDPSSFADRPERPRGSRPPADGQVQLTRLARAGIPVAALRRGDDLAEKLGPAVLTGEAVG